MENFEKMFEESLKSIKEGTVITGKILSISNGEVIVNLGYKADGIVARDQVSYDVNKTPETMYKIGEIIEVYVLRLNDGIGNVALSIKKLEDEKIKDQFEDDIKAGKVLSAKVTDIFEKGVRVDYVGIRVFIPISQLVEKDTQKYAGKTVSFKVIKNENNKVIASERLAVNEKRDSQAKETLEKIAEGQVVKGIVKRINDYGAFVDIGGIEGLLHVSQMTWKRNIDPKTVVKEGQEISVTIIAIDKEAKKISLQMKNENDNPWNKIGTEYNVGTIVDVKVERIVPFGVFVEIKPGMNGFIHISQISDKMIKNPSEILKANQTVTAKIVEIDKDKKRIELSIRRLNEKAEEKTEVETKE